MTADDHPGRADAADPDLDNLIESDPQWSGLVPMVHRLRSATTIVGGDAWVRQQASAAAMVAVHSSEVVPLPTSGRRIRYVRAAAIAAAVTLVAGAGLAAADTLPRPLQRMVSQVARSVGIDIADPDDPAPAPAVVVTPAPTTIASPPTSTTTVSIPDSQVDVGAGQPTPPDPNGQAGEEGRPRQSTQSGPDDPSKSGPDRKSPETDPEDPRREGPPAPPTTQAEPPSHDSEPKSSDGKPKGESDRRAPTPPTTKKDD